MFEERREAASMIPARPISRYRSKSDRMEGTKENTLIYYRRALWSKVRVIRNAYIIVPEIRIIVSNNYRNIHVPLSVGMVEQWISDVIRANKFDHMNTWNFEIEFLNRTNIPCAGGSLIDGG